MPPASSPPAVIDTATIMRAGGWTSRNISCHVVEQAKQNGST